MGYYATGAGYIDYKVALSEDVYQEALEELRDEFDILDANRTWKRTKKSRPQTTFSFGQYSKYYEEDVNETLSRMAEFGEIESGVIEYHGDDNEIWRFIFIDGKWEEQVPDIIWPGGTSA